MSCRHTDSTVVNRFALPNGEGILCQMVCNDRYSCGRIHWTLAGQKITNQRAFELLRQYQQPSTRTVLVENPNLCSEHA